jgi:hypothetical protein
MSIQPQGETLRKAVKYISEEKQAAPDTRLGMLIQQACMKFDLTPKDAEYLTQFYKDKA